MGQSTEDIEAKLAAYVDGELDDAGRAEIEKHLAENPQHMKLVQDLIHGRELLRRLPRAKAPSEIFESIQGHLERRLLLDGSESEAAAGGPSAWPRMMAIAAVVVMSATLALVIYSVLPSPTNTGELATAEQPAGQPLPDGALTDASRRPDGRESARTEVAAGKPERVDDALTAAVDAMRSSTDPDAASGSGATAAGNLSGAIALATGPEPKVDGAGIPRLASSFRMGEASPPVIVVEGEDVVGLTRDVAEVLTSNSVRYEQVAGVPIFAGGGAGRGGGVFDPGSMVPMPADTAASAAAPAAGPSVAGVDEAAKKTVSPVDTPVPGSALANAGFTGGESVVVGRRVSRAQMQAINEALSRRQGLKQQMVPDAEQRQYQQIAQSAGESSARSRGASVESESKDKESLSPPAGAEVDRKLALEPKDLLSPAVRESGKLGKEIAGDEGALVAGDTLTIQNVGDPTATALSATVSQDGTIDIPGIGVVPAAGMSAAEFERELAERYLAAKAVGQPRVSVQRADPGYTDVVVVIRPPKLSEGQPGTTQPSETAPDATAPPAAAPVPATQPTTQPGE